MLASNVLARSPLLANLPPESLAHLASVYGAHPQLLHAVMQINADQRRRLTAKLRDALDGLDGRTVALLGLAFKPATDDVREAPSLELIRLLRNEGAALRVFDPAAAGRVAAEATDLTVAADPYGSHRTCCGCLGRRVSTVTATPSRVSSRTSAVPSRPVPPAITMRTARWYMAGQRT